MLQHSEPALHANTTPQPHRYRLWGELLILFVLLPTVFAAFGLHRPALYLGLWVIASTCFMLLRRQAGWSWRTLWHGRGWSRAQRQQAGVRFLIATLLSLLLLGLFAPERVFDLPKNRPALWGMILLLYPLLSVLPQEFIYRSFFARRYAGLWRREWHGLVSNALCFGYMHIVLQNWVAPLLSLIGGAIFAFGYRQHQSLKWASLEHAAYGCMIFTVGLGWFFFRGV